MEDIRAKLQALVGVMMVPIILPVLVGSFAGIGSAFTNYVLPERNILCGLFTMITNLGFMFIDNPQLWFTVAIVLALTKKEGGWAALTELILFSCFMRGIGSWAALEGWTAETTTVDTLIKNGYAQQAALDFDALWLNSLGIYSYNMGIFSGIIIGLIAAGPHSKLVGIKLLAMFGFFAGTKFVIIMVALASIPLAIAFYYTWPYVAGILQGITGFTHTSGLLGTFMLGTLDKMLLPFGIHHLITFLIEYIRVGGTMVIGGMMYEGVKNTIDGQAASVSITDYITRNFTNGCLLFQLAGLPGVTFTMYRCAKPGDRKKVASLLVPSIFMLATVGISEPIEYTFLFVTPTLYWLVYAPLCDLRHVATEIINILISETVLFFMTPDLSQPQRVHTMNTLWLLPVTFIVYYFAFKFAITELSPKASGRDGKGGIKLMSKKEYNEIKSNGKGEANVFSASEDVLKVHIIGVLGEVDNIEAVICCASRLHVIVKDDSPITPGTSWKNYLEAIGVVCGKNSVQVIYGVRIINITTKVKDYLHLDQL